MNKTVRRGMLILLQDFCPAEALSVWHFVSYRIKAYRVLQFFFFFIVIYEELKINSNEILNSEYRE